MKFILFSIALFFSTLHAVISSSAYLRLPIMNCTGNGTPLCIPFDAITFDDGSCFDLTNGSYVCPGQGTLIITGIIELANLDTSNQHLGVIIKNMTTGEDRYVYAINASSLKNIVPPHGFCQLPYCETMKCNLGDVFQVWVFVVGGPKTVHIYGGNRETRLSMNFFPVEKIFKGIP